MALDSSLCSICHINNPKYTCPACGVKTCSIECVARHKKQTECPGLVDQTKFIPKKNLSGDSTHINRDYNFLLNIDRHIRLGKGDVKVNAKNIFKRQNHGAQQRNYKRFKAGEDKNDADPRISAVHKVYPHQPHTAIKRQNTLIIQLPVGMARSNSNKSGYDKKSGSFTWTVEWVLIGTKGEEITRFLSYRLREHLILKDTVPLNILNNSVTGSKVEKDQLNFYLDNVVNSENTKKSIIELDKEKSISETLKDKIVLEFPTVFITIDDETWKESIVSEDVAYDLISESDSSSGSGSDSDNESENSSDSDSDNESSDDDDTESDSDSAPEEASSKEPRPIKFDNFEQKNANDANNLDNPAKSTENNIDSIA